MKVPLSRIAHARSGDKGDGSNVGLLADSPQLYEVIRREVTAERVKAHFRDVCRGEVERFEVPNLLGLNFLLHDSLGGGGTLSLKTDAQGKTHGQGILQLVVEVPDELVPPERGAQGAPAGTVAAADPPAASGGAASSAGRPADAAGSAEALKGV
jgi:hypothetical protein